MKIKSEILRLSVFLFTIYVGLGLIYFVESVRFQENPQIQHEKSQQAETIEGVDDNKVIANTTSENHTRKLESLSPYDLQTYIDRNKDISLEKIWEELDISSRYYGEYFDENSKNGFFDYCNFCEAELFEFNIDEDQKTEKILRISEGFRKWRYVVFKHTDLGEWKAIGLADFSLGKYREPQHYFFASEGRNYFVITHQTGSGSGFAQYFDSVFTVKNGKLIELLRYPANGHESSTSEQPNIEFTGKVKKVEIKSGKAQIELEYNVTYEAFEFESNSNFLLFEKKYKAIYTKNLSNGKMNSVIYNGKEEIKLKGTDKMVNVLSLEKFAKYNLGKLSQFARKKGKREHSWLKTHLSFSSDSPEERYLLKIMRN